MNKLRQEAKAISPKFVAGVVIVTWIFLSGYLAGAVLLVLLSAKLHKRKIDKEEAETQKFIKEREAREPWRLEM